MENTNNVLALFNDQITEQGLTELRGRFPSDLVVDMTDEAQFKEARKVRTERNKLTKAINDRRLDVTKELKNEGDSLISQVNEIFSVMVDPFETEDKKRKDEVDKVKRELEILLNQELARISSIKNFITQCFNQKSDYIADMIESVELIETESFHKDVIHEAIQAKKETIAQLTQMMIDAKGRERLEEERAVIAKEKAEMEEERLAFEKFKRQQAEQSQSEQEVQKPTEEPKEVIVETNLGSEPKTKTLKQKLRSWQLDNNISDLAMHELVAIQEISDIL